MLSPGETTNMQGTPGASQLGKKPFLDPNLLEAISRSCTRCRLEKLFEEFRYVKSRAVYYAMCSECEKGSRRERYSEDRVRQLSVQHIWKDANADKIKQYKAIDYKKHKAKRDAARRRHYEANRAMYRLYAKNRANGAIALGKFPTRVQNGFGLEKPQPKPAPNPFHKKEVKARKSASNLLRQKVQNCIKGGNTANKVTGCSFTHLREWFEFNFRIDAHLGMNWNNYGKVWEIDHVVPCRSHNLNLLEEVRRCNHWTNLAPITKAHNRKKHGKRSEDDENRQKERLKLFNEQLAHKQASSTALEQ